MLYDCCILILLLGNRLCAENNFQAGKLFLYTGHYNCFHILSWPYISMQLFSRKWTHFDPCLCSTEVSLLTGFCWMVLLENQHSMSTCSQSAAALISVFSWWWNPAVRIQRRISPSTSNVWIGKSSHIFFFFMKKPEQCMYGQLCNASVPRLYCK